jgi:hypothetical protein
LVVGGDRGGEAAEACEGEEVFAGPEDRFDPLADGREMRPCSAFLLAARALERGVRFGVLGREAVAGVAGVAERDLAAVAGGGV